MVVWKKSQSPWIDDDRFAKPGLCRRPYRNHPSSSVPTKGEKAFVVRSAELFVASRVLFDHQLPIVPGFRRQISTMFYSFLQYRRFDILQQPLNGFVITKI